MRQWTDILDYRPLLVGSLAGVANGTICGDAVDVAGFADIMAIVTYAVVGGTAAAEAQLEIRFQEADAAADTGGSMTDITDGAIMGSMKIITAVGVAPSNPYLASTSFYERMSDSKRKRYLRPIAKLVGTSGVEFVLTIGVLLGRPRDTLYIAKGTVFTTSNAEYSLLQL